MKAAPWHLAWKFAWREVRGGIGTLKLLAVCLFLGVFALAAIGSLSASIENSIRTHGRELLGGDLAIQLTQRLPSSEEEEIIHSLGGEQSRSLHMRAMAHTRDGRQLLVELKAVDNLWPLYGETSLATGNAGVQQALSKGVVLSKALASRLSLGVGNYLTLGHTEFPITGIIENEPDKAGEGLAFGPTVLLHLDKATATGLIQEGSLFHYRMRLRLPSNMSVAAAKSKLNTEAPEAGWRLSDSQDGAPGISRFTKRMEQLLSFIGLAVIAIAAVGASNGVRSYLEMRLGTIGTLKALGASSALVTRTYLLIIGMVTLVSAGIGALLGSVVPYILSLVAADLIPIELESRIFPEPLFFAIIYGCLIALACALPPIIRAGALSVQQVLRANVRGLPGYGWCTLLWSGVAAAILLILVVWRAYEPGFALLFIGGTAILTFLLGVLGVVVVWLARKLPRPTNLQLKLALSSLARPGAFIPQLVMALGLGLTLFASLSLIETSFRHQLLNTIPENAPTHVVLDLPKDEKEQFLALLPKDAEVDLVPTLRGPVTAVKDTPVSSYDTIPEALWVLRGDRSVTFTSSPPSGNRIVAGEWWPENYSGTPLVSMDAEQARLLGLQLGDSITLSILGVSIEATITSLRHVDWDSLGFNFVLIYNPSALEAAPYSWMATIRVPDAESAGLVRQVAKYFPTASILDVGDIVSEVDRMGQRILTAVRLTSVAAILAGVSVLIGALAAQARTRQYENAIFKVLGATRRQLTLATATEFLMLGAAISLISLGLGAIISALVTHYMFKISWHPDWPVAVATVSAGAIAILLLGMAGNWRILGASPNEILRRS